VKSLRDFTAVTYALSNSSPTALIEPSLLYNVEPVPTKAAPLGSWDLKRAGDVATKGKYISTNEAESRKGNACLKNLILKNMISLG
jgi:hypothetical protein